MTLATALQDMPLPPAPFVSSVMHIEPQWIDYNGHLNMAYYNVMMDRAIDELWLQLGIGPTYMKERHGSTSVGLPTDKKFCSNGRPVLRRCSRSKIDSMHSCASRSMVDMAAGTTTS